MFPANLPDEAKDTYISMSQALKTTNDATRLFDITQLNDDIPGSRGTRGSLDTAHRMRVE